MSPLLKQWLGAMYRADVLKEGSLDAAVALVKGRFEADQDLQKEARDELRALKPVAKARGGTSYIEAKTVEYLEILLGKKDQA